MAVPTSVHAHIDKERKRIPLMKINEVEKVTGITSSNIRYYERKELLVPQRSNENNYRLYDADDIERLKQIKILRMMGIAISDIKDIFDGKADFKTAVSQRLNELETEEQNIATVKNLCHTVLEYDMEIETLNEELLTENTELWKQKLKEINLEEKAYYLNRIASILLCIVTILLSFSPLMAVDGKMLNILQILFSGSYNFKTEVYITAVIYLTIPVIYGYLLYCYSHHKYSLIFMDIHGIAERIAFGFICVLNMMMLSFCDAHIETNPYILVCMSFVILRMLIAFFLLICYASGEELFLYILKSKKKH